MEDRFCQLVSSALQGLLDAPVDQATIRMWRGRGKPVDWLRDGRNASSSMVNAPKCIVIVEFARWALSKNAPATLSRALTLEPSERNISPRDFLASTIEAAIKQREQRLNQGNSSSGDRTIFVQQLPYLAICYAVLAAIYYSRVNQVPEAHEAIAAAKDCLESWKIVNEFLLDTNIGSGQECVADVSKPDSYNLLQGAWVSMFDSENEERRKFRTSSWLTLQVLLDYIFADDNEPRSGFQNKLKVLTTEGVSGSVIPVVFERIESDVAGAFLDPFDFAGLELDKPMNASLRLAWRCCKQTKAFMDQRQKDDSHRNAIRISAPKQLPDGLSFIGGGSAGAIFTAGMIATMDGQRLDTNRTATCALYYEGDVDSNDTIKPNQLSFSGVGGKDLKLDAVWFQRFYGIDEVFLCQSDFDSWNVVNPGWKNKPSVTAVSNLYDLITKMCANQAHERILEQHAIRVHEMWDLGVQTQKSKTLHDLDHRLDCYVSPTLVIEAPMVSKSSETTVVHRRTVSNSHFSRDTYTPPSVNDVRTKTDKSTGKGIPFEPEDDTQLLHILDLYFHGRIHVTGSPHWLNDCGNKSIVIYDRAGAGKTVCTLRLQRILTDKQYQTRYFGSDASPLIIRLEGHWPEEGERLLSIRKLLKLRLRVESKLSEEEFQRLEFDLDKAIGFAIDQGRVLLILDGLDQFYDHQIEQIVELRNGGSTQDHEDASKIRWIVTSREHRIHEYRGRLFKDDKWLRVRIEPFSAAQRDAYFDRGGDRVGDAWKRMVPYVDGISELLGLPMALAMLRLMHNEAKLNKKEPWVFDSLSSLALITSRTLLARALDKNKDVVEKALNEHRLPRPYKLGSDEELELLEHVLTLIAFQFMVMEIYDGRVFEKELVDRIQHQCWKRFERNMTKKAAELAPTGNTPETLWHWAIRVLRTIELNYQTMTSAISERAIAFRSRKMMEYFAARYLTRYATVFDIFGTNDSNDLTIVDLRLSTQNLESLCAWNYTNEGQWEDTWLLAISMPLKPIVADLDSIFQEAAIDHLVTCRSLSALFRRPKRGLRPNFLTFCAWPLFEVDDFFLSHVNSYPSKNESTFGSMCQQQHDSRTLPIAEITKELLLGEIPDCVDCKVLRQSTIRDFRATSKDVLREIASRLEKYYSDPEDGGAVPVKAYARQKFLERWNRVPLNVKSVTFLQFPPQTWLDAYDAIPESKQIEVRNPRKLHNLDSEAEFKPFRVASGLLPVDRYIVFDPSANVTIAESTQAKSGSTCAISGISFFDAWTYCRWLGSNFHLPIPGKYCEYFPNHYPESSPCLVSQLYISHRRQTHRIAKAPWGRLDDGFFRFSKCTEFGVEKIPDSRYVHNDVLGLSFGSEVFTSLPIRQRAALLYRKQQLSFGADLDAPRSSPRESERYTQVWMSIDAPYQSMRPQPLVDASGPEKVPKRMSWSRILYYLFHGGRRRISASS